MWCLEHNLKSCHYSIAFVAASLILIHTMIWILKKWKEKVRENFQCAHWYHLVDNFRLETLQAALKFHKSIFLRGFSVKSQFRSSYSYSISCRIQLTAGSLMSLDEDNTANIYNHFYRKFSDSHTF